MSETNGRENNVLSFAVRISLLTRNNEEPFFYSERKNHIRENSVRNRLFGNTGLKMSKNISYEVYYECRSLTSEPRRERRNLLQHLKITADGPPYVTHILSEKHSTKGKPLERVGRKASDLLGSARL